MRRLINCLVFLFLVNSVVGQQYKGNLPQVNQDGLHYVNLSPQVRSAAKDNLDFFRILDKKNNEVPYTVFSSKGNAFSLKTCKIVERKMIPNKATAIIVENLNARKLDRLLLKIGNASVTKKYSISGSNDKKEWFGLVNNEEISDLYQEGQTTVDREFSFPLHNYKYIKFDFIDKNSLPINVMNAYYLENIQINTPLSTKLTGFTHKIEHDKSRKVTVIRISFETPQIINGINFKITSPSMYLRDAKIVVNRSEIVKRKKVEYAEAIRSFQLNSNAKNHFEFTEIFEKEFVVEIENQDNPQLTIQTIELLQRPLKIIADLKRNESYKVVIDSVYTKPNYDIINFESNFDKELPEITIAGFQKIQPSDHLKSEKFWQTKWFLWVAISVGGAFIAYFALGLLKDLEKKD